MVLENEEIREVFRKLISFDEKKRMEATENLMVLYLSNREYSLNRLLKGLGSSNEFARVGFALALSELLAKYPEQTILSQIKDHFSPKTVSVIGKREANCGLITSLHAVVLSKMELDEEQTTWIVQKLLHYLLNEPIYSLFAASVLVDMLDHDKMDVALIVSKLLTQQVKGAVESWNINVFYLVFTMKKLYGDRYAEFPELSPESPDIELFAAMLSSAPVDVYSLSKTKPIGEFLHPLWSLCFQVFSKDTSLALWRMLDEKLFAGRSKGELIALGAFQNLILNHDEISIYELLNSSKNTVVFLATFQKVKEAKVKRRTPRAQHTQDITADHVENIKLIFQERIASVESSAETGKIAMIISKYHILSTSVHQTMLKFLKQVIHSLGSSKSGEVDASAAQAWGEMIDTLFSSFADPVNELEVELTDVEQADEAIQKIRWRIVEVLASLFPLLDDEDVQFRIVRGFTELVMFKDTEKIYAENVADSLRKHLFSLLSHAKRVTMLERFCRFLSDNADNIHVENEKIAAIISDTRRSTTKMKLTNETEGLYWLLLALAVNSIFTSNSLSIETYELLVSRLAEIQKISNPIDVGALEDEDTVTYFMQIMFSSLSLPSFLVRMGALKAFTAYLDMIPERLLSDMLELLTDVHEEDEEMEDVEEGAADDGEGDDDEDEDEDEDKDDEEDEEDDEDEDDSDDDADDEDEDGGEEHEIPAHKLLSLRMYAMGTTSDEMMRIDAIREKIERENRKASGLDVKYKVLEMVEKIIAHKKVHTFIYSLPKLLILATVTNSGDAKVVKKVDSLLQKLYHHPNCVKGVPEEKIPVIFKSLDDLFELIPSVPSSHSGRIGAGIAFLLKILRKNDALLDSEIRSSVVNLYKQWAGDFVSRRAHVSRDFFAPLVHSAPEIFCPVALLLLDAGKDERPFVVFNVFSLLAEVSSEPDILISPDFSEIADGMVKIVLRILESGSAENCRKIMNALALFARKLQTQQAKASFDEIMEKNEVPKKLREAMTRHGKKKGVVASLGEHLRRLDVAEEGANTQKSQEKGKKNGKSEAKEHARKRKRTFEEVGKEDN